MWFWRKRSKVTYTDPLLGELVYRYGAWMGRATVEGIGEVHFSVTGDKSKPDFRSILHAKTILGNFGTFLVAAKNFLKTQDLGDWLDPVNGELEFQAFAATQEVGAFELNFGLSKWPDAMIGVSFVGGQPVEVNLAD